jgi:adenylate cyclase
MERKLAAILCADVHGYSRLMGADEEATVRTLASHRKIIDRLIERHHGHFVNSAGDSVLAEFASVVNSVQCGIEIQTALKTENTALPLNRRMEFRMGINLGDVIVNGEQIYGDGVNVAARLESLAEPGGICISETVHAHVRNKLSLNYHDLGEQRVKNIAEPVRVWRVLLDSAAATRVARNYWRRGVLSLAGLAVIIVIIVLVQHLSLKPPHTSASIPPTEKPDLSLPSIPSIAVLPFANLSGDPQQAYFSDGITDDLVTDLSRLPGLFVIDRSSTFTYKGKAVRALEVGRELGVKYVLEGSARKAADRVRINVQLVDASTGNEIWAQRYDKRMNDIFALQDEIVQSLVTTLNLELKILQRGFDLLPQRTENLEAYDYWLRGFEVWASGPTPDALPKAQKMFEKALELDSSYADAYAMLGYLAFVAYVWQWNNNRDSLDRAARLANKAIALDESNVPAYMVRGWVEAVNGQRDQAFADAEHTVSLDPNMAFAWAVRADINNILIGKPKDTLAYSQKAKRLDPRHPDITCLQEGTAYIRMGLYTDAIEAQKGCEPTNPYSHLNLIVAYSALGREQEARAEAAEVLRVSPGFTLEKLEQRIPGNWQDPRAQRFLALLGKAGLK